MDSATEDLYLQKLEEFVYDEEKIVTTRWLSCHLDINIKESKSLLEKYISDTRDTKHKHITLTYVLTGTFPDDTLHITVVKENDLKEKSALFTRIIDQQVYSVQKCKELDLNILSMVDYFDNQNPREKSIGGSVISNLCIERILKVKKLVSPVRKSAVESKPSFFANVAPKSNVKNEATDTSKSVKATPPKTKQNGGIASFFNKPASQAVTKSPPEKTDIKPKVATTVAKSHSQKNEVKPEALKNVSCKTASPKPIVNLIDSESDSDDIKSQPQSKPKNAENIKPKRSAKRQKKNRDKSPNPKRRKRIIQQDSDSDDMFGSDGKEDSTNEVVIDNSEDEMPKVKPKPPLAPKNKKRKLIDRTYTDEEGYIITTKEWIEESPSEDEVVLDPPKQEPKKVETKPEVKNKNEDKKLTKSESSDLSDANNKVVNGTSKGGKKGKKVLAANQPTLMNFFKRA